MRLGIAEKTDKILPKYWSHLIWVVLHGIKHPSSLVINSNFLLALRENMGLAGRTTSANQSFNKPYGYLRIGYLEKKHSEFFSRYCTMVDLSDQDKIRSISNRPLVDFCLVGRESINKLPVKLGETPLAFVVDQETADYPSNLDEHSPVFGIAMTDSYKELPSEIDTIAPSKDRSNLWQIITSVKTPSAKMFKQSPHESKLIALIKNAKKHHDPRLELLERCLQRLGYEKHQAQKISVLAPTNRAEYIDKIIESFNSQTYENKELVLILHGIELPDSIKLPEGTIIIKCKSSEIFGSCLNKGLDQSTGDLIAKIDDDDIYGEDHLYDLLYARQDSGADIVGKWGHFVLLDGSKKILGWHKEHADSFCAHLPGGTMLASRETIKAFRFGRVKNAIDSEMLKRMRSEGRVLYSTHQYNYVRVRHSDGHTWNRPDAEFIEESDGEIDDLNIYELSYTNKDKLLKSIKALQKQI